MKQELCRVRSLQEVADNIFVLTFASSHIGTTLRAGQFVNIRVDNSGGPLLRRPYSVYYVQGDNVQIIFNIVGRGSSALRRKREGDLIDILGPLGVPFTLAGADFDTAILVAGGLGLAPLPLATLELARSGRSVVTLLGSRTARHLVDTHLTNVHVATEDGSTGLRGTVVDLARKMLSEGQIQRPKLFGCGPTAMLRALGALAMELGLPCEVSLEGPMACGFGICQGCPVELVGSERKYALMCKDGPTFDIRKIKL